MRNTVVTRLISLKQFIVFILSSIIFFHIVFNDNCLYIAFNDYFPFIILNDNCLHNVFNDDCLSYNLRKLKPIFLIIVLIDYSLRVIYSMHTRPIE